MLVIIRVKLIVEYSGDLFLIRLILFHIGLSAITDTVCHKTVSQVIVSLYHYVVTATLTDFRIEWKGVVLEGGRHLAADCCLISLKWFLLRCLKSLPFVQSLSGSLTCSILEATLFKFIFVFLKDVLRNFAVFQRFNLDNAVASLAWNLAALLLRLLLHSSESPASSRWQIKRVIFTFKCPELHLSSFI